MPIQLQNPLARIQPVKQDLPSLDTVRADLIKLEMDTNQPPLVRMLAGAMRTLTDHMRLFLVGQKMQTKTLSDTMEAKFQGLVAELNALLNPQPAPDANAAPTPEQTAILETPAAAPAQPVATPEPEPSPTAPQFTVTPKVKPNRRGGAA